MAIGDALFIIQGSVYEDLLRYLGERSGRDWRDESLRCRRFWLSVNGRQICTILEHVARRSADKLRVT